MDIVVGTDLSENSIPALSWAFDWKELNKEMGTNVTVNVVYVAKARYPQAADVASEAATPEKRKKAETKVRDWIDEQLDDPPNYNVEIEGGDAREQLAGAVETHDADWLAIGLTGRGAWSRFIAGSTSLGLAHSPPTNMALCHPKGKLSSELDDLCVGVDFSDHSRGAFDLAAKMAKMHEISLHAVNVVFPPPPITWPEASADVPSDARESMDARVERAEDEMEEWLEQFRKDYPNIQIQSHILQGYAAKEIKDLVEDKKLDGIVLSSKGRSGVADFFMGSVANALLKNAPTSIFLAPPE